MQWHHACCLSSLTSVICPDLVSLEQSPEKKPALISTETAALGCRVSQLISVSQSCRPTAGGLRSTKHQSRSPYTEAPEGHSDLTTFYSSPATLRTAAKTRAGLLYLLSPVSARVSLSGQGLSCPSVMPVSFPCLILFPGLIAILFPIRRQVSCGQRRSLSCPVSPGTGPSTRQAAGEVLRELFWKEDACTRVALTVCDLALLPLPCPHLQLQGTASPTSCQGKVEIST